MEARRLVPYMAVKDGPHTLLPTYGDIRPRQAALHGGYSQQPVHG